MLAPAARSSSATATTSRSWSPNDKVQQRALKLGRTLGDDREVLDGLAGGDTVVLAPPEALADGGAHQAATQTQAQ